MVFLMLPSGAVIYQASYNGNLERLNGLTTEEILAEQRKISSCGTRFDRFLYFFNYARRGHIDAVSTVLEERATAGRGLSDSDRFPEHF
ncbi:MAG: hypothetical protein AABY16_01770 [Nanoarchaeota archaeon]